MGFKGIDSKRIRILEADYRSPLLAGEMSPNSIPKYLKRPLWRERKCEGWGTRGRTTVGQRRARQSHGAPRPRRAASRIPARLPPNLFTRDMLTPRNTVLHITISSNFTFPVLNPFSELWTLKFQRCNNVWSILKYTAYNYKSLTIIAF